MCPLLVPAQSIQYVHPLSSQAFSLGSTVYLAAGMVGGRHPGLSELHTPQWLQ